MGFHLPFFCANIIGKGVRMGYLICSAGNAFYLLDKSTKKCGAFINDSFKGFVSFLDKNWERREVGVVGVISNGIGDTSLLCNNKSYNLKEMPLNVAKTLRKKGRHFKVLILRGTINNLKVNGYIFIYESEMIAKEVCKGYELL